MADVQSLETLVINIEARINKLEESLNKAEADGVKAAKNIENAFGKTNPQVGTDGIKKLNSEVDNLKPKLKANTEEMSRWAMIITGINQGFQFLKDSVNGFKNLVMDSVNKANELAETKSYFKGSADDVELFKKAVKDTEEEGSLIALSNQASDLGINTKDQVILFALAKRAAEAYGGDVSAGMQKVIYASEGNLRGIRALGIQTMVYTHTLNDLAIQHGGNINMLDADTQKQLRLQAIIKASGMTMEEATDGVKSNDDAYKALSVRIDEVKLKFGQLVSDSLMPLIGGLDKSSKSTKDFVSAIFGIGGVVVNAIPLLVNLYTAQAMLGFTSITTAGQIDVATGSLAAFDKTAKGSLLFKMLGFAGAGAGAALFVANSFKQLQHPEEAFSTQLFNKAIANDTTKTPEIPSNVKIENGFYKFTDDVKKSTDDSVNGNNKVADSWNLVGKSIDQVEKRMMELRKQQANLADPQVADAVVNNQIEKELKLDQIRLQELQKEKELHDKNKAIVKGYYDEVTFLDNSYWKYRWQVFQDEYKKIENLNLTAAQKELMIETLKINTKKKLNEDYTKYLSDLLKKQTGNDAYQFNENGEINVNSGNGSAFSSFGAMKPHKLTVPVDFNDQTGNSTDSNAPTSEKIIEDWVNKVPAMKIAFDGVVGGITEGLNEIRIRTSETASTMEKIFANMANMMLQAFEQIIAKWAVLNILSFAIGGPGIGLGKMLTGHSGGEFMGTPKGAIKLAGGGSFMIPNGYPNDSFGPLFLESGEKVNVTSANKVGDQERILGQLLNQNKIMTMYMIEANMKDNLNISEIPVTGEIQDRTIYLANKKANKVTKRIS